MKGEGEGVRSCRGTDHGTGSVQHPRHDDVKALAHPGRPYEQCRVLDRAPQLVSTQPTKCVADLSWSRHLVQARSHDEGAPPERSLAGCGSRFRSGRETRQGADNNEAASCLV
jgi:hypothetical protein